MSRRARSSALIALKAFFCDDLGLAETFLEFRDTGRVVQFDTFAFATDQAGFAQDFEMLGLDK